MQKANPYAMWTWTVLLVTCAAPARAAYPINFSLDWTHYGETSAVQFRAWIPDGLDRVKGIMLALPGSGGDIRNITTNGTWQTRLPAMEFGIVGVRDVLDTAYWGADEAEMQSNIQDMLDALATASSRPEISNAPIFPFGHSKGAFAASSIVQGVPERTLGFFSDKTFTGAGYIVESAVAAVPGLAVAGTGDEYIPEEYARSAFDSWRSQGAEVSLVVEGGGHNQTRPDLRFAFIDEVLKLRYPQGQAPSLEPGNPLALNTVNVSDGWLADSPPLDGTSFVPMVWPEIAPVSEYTGDPTTASWLPSQTMAMVYRAHTHRPVGINSNALSIFASDDGIEEVQYVVSVDFDGVAYENVDIYHGDQLIAHLGYSPDTLRVPFTPTTIGNHTFIAVAEYLYEGQTHYTSAYSTFYVPVLPAVVPEPATASLFAAGIVVLWVFRRR